MLLTGGVRGGEVKEGVTRCGALTAGGHAVGLDVCRGAAAVVVLLHHSVLSFLPAVSGFLPFARNADSLVGSPFFWVMNGFAAVTFFFVLSGYVLSIRHLQRFGWRRWLLAVLRRTPRLMGLVFVLMAASGALFALDGYRFVEAGERFGSEWLRTLGGGVGRDFQPTLWGSVWQGLTSVFTGAANYNTNFWTIHIEWLGSVLVFVLVWLVAALRRVPLFADVWVGRLLFWLVVVGLVGVAVRSGWLVVWMLAFLMGVLVADVRCWWPRLVVPGWVSVALVVLACYCFGFVEPLGAYRWLAPFWEAGRVELVVAIHVLGAILLVVAVAFGGLTISGWVRRMAIWLGSVSFALYGVHVLVLGSVGSGFALWLLRAGVEQGVAACCALALSVAVSFAVAVPLSWLDERWVRWLGSVSERARIG